ncbi:MAG TPA: hypothetical protein VGM75_11220 [Pseudonocardiaceae bacterium]|jgi:hypothetical protein
MTAPTTTASSGSSTGVNLTQLLSDLDSATSAVAGGDWLTGGLDGASAALDLLGSGSDPLSSIVEAGFGLVMPFVQFLKAPLQLLTGDASSTSSSAQSGQSAGQSVDSVAGSYQQAASTQTSGWSGTAASNYQTSASDLATELRAIAKSTTGISSAVTAAGKVVGSTQQQCGQLVSEAATKINAIMTPAMASAQATFGASIAAAIPQVVAVATDYGGQIATKMGALLSSAQNLAALVLVVVRCLEAANTALTETTGSGSSSSTSKSTSSTGQSTSLAGQPTSLAGQPTSATGQSVSAVTT